MSKKLYLLLVLITILPISVSAQVEAEIIRPSINAEQFGFALKTETALNKGQLSVNIPLMELQGKGYNLPISLSFYNGDVTARTEASPVGLGWALMAGGVIASTIKGSDDIDDLMEYGELNHFADNEYVEKLVKDDFFYHKLERIQWNSMPDEYTYSLPGHSGRIEFTMDENKTIKKTLFPDETYKIEDTDHGYCITADDGTKFYFEAVERRVIGSGPEITESNSYFLTRIETVIGGCFLFEYEDEDYYDLSMIRDQKKEHDIYQTKRITKIESVGFGSIIFDAKDRDDRGDISDYWSIDSDKKSKRIYKIELKDKDGHLIKGYELDNSGTFILKCGKNETPSNEWYDCRHKLSSITQYNAEGDSLPPYKFTYDYSLSKSWLQSDHWNNTGYEYPYDSWTSSIIQNFIDLAWGVPYCSADNNMPNYNGEGTKGFSYYFGGYQGSIAGDYFCLTRIDYPNGAVDEYDYEPHHYSKINNMNAREGFLSTEVQGRRLAMKKHYGSEVSQQTKYIYALHDTNYNIKKGSSSGVLTNPSIHNATYYTPRWVADGSWQQDAFFAQFASRISSGKPFNSFMGPPVCYTEVEEAETQCYDDTIIYINRTIHYFEPQIVSPAVNYILYHPSNDSPLLVKIDNYIWGTSGKFSHGMEGYNDTNCCYIAYPVGEFCNTATIVDLPLKEVFIGKNDKVRSVKIYNYYDANSRYIKKKYGYQIVSPENADYTLISKSEYYIRRTRLANTTTTYFYYNGEKRDSVNEYYSIDYNKGRTILTNTSNGSNYIDNNAEEKTTKYYYPDEIRDITDNNSSPSQELAAMKRLIEKNMIAEPIKTTVERNSSVVGGECKDFQMIVDSIPQFKPKWNKGKVNYEISMRLDTIPLLKSLYKMKVRKSDDKPVVKDNTIDYRTELYKEGEIITYDKNLNPEYVRLNDSQDRIYVWGYDGRYPIAVIDNMNLQTFKSSNLKSEILKLEQYKKIENEGDCNSLRSLNTNIRNMIPKSAHITTYTYNPYFGMTSEMDDSNLGVIFTYDTFGRLTAKYDENYKKIEEYNYHLKLQQ